MKQQARFVEVLDVFGCCPRERVGEAHSAQLGKPMDAQTLQMMVCLSFSHEESKDVKQRTCFFGVACCELLCHAVLSEVCWSWLLWSIQRVCPSVSWYHYTPRHHFPLTGLAKPPFVAWGGANVNQDLYPKVLTVGCSLKVGDVNFYKQPKIALERTVFLDFC